MKVYVTVTLLHSSATCTDAPVGWTQNIYISLYTKIPLPPQWQSVVGKICTTRTPCLHPRMEILLNSIVTDIHSEDRWRPMLEVMCDDN